MRIAPLWAVLALCAITAFTGCSKTSPADQLKAVFRPVTFPIEWKSKHKTFGPCTNKINAKDVTFDVKSTASLVTPYEAEVWVTVWYEEDPGQSQHDSKYLRKYKYQNGAWVRDETRYFFYPYKGSNFGVQEISPAGFREYDDAMDRVLKK